MEKNSLDKCVSKMRILKTNENIHSELHEYDSTSVKINGRYIHGCTLANYWPSVF